MSLLRYELKKVISSGLCIIISVALLLGNGILFWNFESRKDSFYYIHEHRDDYLAYQRGDKREYNASFYDSECVRKGKDIEAYNLFRKQMSDRAEEMSKIAIFSEKSTFSNRNIRKTVEAYNKPWKNINEKTDTYTLDAYASYEWGIFFLAAFIMAEIWFLIFRERNKDLFRLLRGCKRGRSSLAFAKFTVLIGFAGAYSIIQSVSEIVISVCIYGNLHRYADVHSSSLFRGCTLNLTMPQTVFLSVLIRVFVAAGIAALLGMIGFLIYTEIEGLLIFLLVLIGSFLTYKVISLSSSLSFFKCISPFYVWTVRNSLGEYHNLNVLGYPVPKSVVQSVFAIFIILSSVALGVFSFCRGSQVRRESRVERVVVKLRKRLSFAVRHTSLLYYELYKTLFQRKKIVIILLLFVWCISESQKAASTAYYLTLEEAAYHFYMDKYEGIVTAETESDIGGEKRALEGEQNRLFDDASLAAALLMKNQVYFEGIKRVSDQLEEVRIRNNGDEEIYLVDEPAYENIWSRAREGIIAWFICILLELTLISGLYPSESDMMPMIRITKKGEAAVKKAKNIAAILFCALTYLLYDIPEIVRLFMIDGFKCMGASMSSFVSHHYISSMSIGMFLACKLVCDAIFFAGIGMIELLVSEYMKKELLSWGTVGAFVVAFSAVFYYFAFDLYTLLLEFITIRG